MTLSRGWSIFLLVVGIWAWVIWPRFAVAIWDDPRAWSAGVSGQGSPTGFFWVHALIIIVSLALATATGVLGIRGVRRSRANPRELISNHADLP
ncbi:hypothetical protein AB0J86_34470 [Micromonospora sp. NPDC049559]|uniref:SCO4848 family membrane protein n=1 Tax=Micromonospora sp. NPDC049559 TaxID=3155923 RepID=UPI00342CB5E8